MERAVFSTWITFRLLSNSFIDSILAYKYRTISQRIRCHDVCTFYTFPESLSKLNNVYVNSLETYKCPENSITEGDPWNWHLRLEMYWIIYHNICNSWNIIQTPPPTYIFLLFLFLLYQNRSIKTNFCFFFLFFDQSNMFSKIRIKRTLE